MTNQCRALITVAISHVTFAVQVALHSPDDKTDHHEKKMLAVIFSHSPWTEDASIASAIFFILIEIEMV